MLCITKWLDSLFNLKTNAQYFATKIWALKFDASSNLMCTTCDHTTISLTHQDFSHLVYQISLGHILTHYF